MSISVLSHDRIPMSQKERDVLKILHAVLGGERTQAEAARLLDSIGWRRSESDTERIS